MSSGRAKQIISQQGKQIASLKGRMKLGKFMSLPEDDFQKLIKEIKNDSLFKRLAAPDTKVIRHKKFPGTSLASSKTIPLDPAITPSQNSFELEPFLSQEKDITLIIKSLGVDRFKKYFLDGGCEIALEEIARECDLTIEEVKKVNSFVNRFYLQTKSTESPMRERELRGFVISL